VRCRPRDSAASTSRTRGSACATSASATGCASEAGKGASEGQRWPNNPIRCVRKTRLLGVLRRRENACSAKRARTGGGGGGAAAAPALRRACASVSAGRLMQGPPQNAMRRVQRRAQALKTACPRGETHLAGAGGGRGGWPAARSRRRTSPASAAASRCDQRKRLVAPSGARPTAAPSSGHSAARDTPAAAQAARVSHSARVSVIQRCETRLGGPPERLHAAQPRAARWRAPPAP
jgi:hypothetical protein